MSAASVGCSIATPPNKNAIKTLRLAGAAVCVVVLVVAAAWIARDWRGGTTEPESDWAPAPVWVERGPETPTTLVEIVSIPDDFERNAALYELIAEADRDLVEQHLRAVDDLGAFIHRADVVRVLYVRYASLDPVAAADHVLDGERKYSWVAAVFRAWARVDLDGAIDRAGSLDPRLRSMLAEALLELDLTVGERAEVAFRLDAVGKLVARHSEGEIYADLWERAIEAERGRRGRIDALVTAWAEEDPEAALTALVSLHDSDLHADVVDEVLQEWLTAQPGEAGQWLAGQPPSMWSYMLATNSLSSLLEEDVPAALAAAKAFPAADFDSLARRGFGKALEHDFDTAVAWLETVEASSGTGLRQAYAREYGRREPREALDWAMYGETDEARRPQRVREVFRGIARGDWTQARRLLDVVGDPASRLEAARVVVGSASADEWNVEDSLGLARSFRSEVHRARLTADVFSRWSRAFDVHYIGGSAIRGFRGDASYANAEVAGDAALGLARGVVRDAALASVIANVVGRDPALAERLFAGLQGSRYRAWGAARLYAHFADTAADTAKSSRYRLIMEAECES